MSDKKKIVQNEGKFIKVKYNTTLTEITEHYQACFRVLPGFVAWTKAQLLL